MSRTDLEVVLQLPASGEPVLVGALERTLTALVDDLELPLQPRVRTETADLDRREGAAFVLEIGGRPAPPIAEDLPLEEAITFSAFRSRGHLAHPALAAAIAAAAPSLSAETVRLLLSESLRRGLRLTDACAAAAHLARLDPSLRTDPYTVEIVLDAVMPRGLQVGLAPDLHDLVSEPNADGGEARPFVDLLKGWRDEFHDATGLRLPIPQISREPALAERTLYLRTGWARGPALRIAVATPAAVLTGIARAVEAELPLMSTPALVEASLHRLNTVYPMLVLNVMERFPLGTLSEAFRLLVAERVPVADWWKILNTWVRTPGVAPWAPGIDLIPLAGTSLCPPTLPGDTPETPLEARHLAAAARLALRSALLKRRKAGGEQPFLTIDDDVAGAIRAWDRVPPLPPGTARSLRLALEAQAELVMVVPPDVRSTVAAWIGEALPQLPVLSDLERDPALRWRSAGTIGLVAPPQRFAMKAPRGRSRPTGRGQA